MACWTTHGQSHFVIKCQLRKDANKSEVSITVAYFTQVLSNEFVNKVNKEIRFMENYPCFITSLFILISSIVESKYQYQFVVHFTLAMEKFSFVVFAECFSQF
jgi:hypothetical protein